MEYLLMFTDADEDILSAYTLVDSVYTLNDKSHKNKEALSERFTMPMVCVSMLRAGGDEMKAMLTASLPEGSYDPSAEAAEILYSLPEQLREPMTAGLREQFSEYLTLGTMVDQMAVEYVKTEYEAVGMDLDSIQMRYIMTAGLKMLGFSLLIVAAAILISLFASRVAAKFGESLRLAVFRQVVSFSGSEFNTFSTASLITRCTNDIQQIQMLVVMLLRMVLYAPILGVGALLKIGGSGMMWVIGLAILCIVCIIIFLLIFAMPKFNKLQKMIDKINLVSREILTGIPVIRAFSRERHEEKRFDKANVELTRTNLFVNRTMTLMMPLMTFIMNGVSLLIIWVGADLIDGGTMQVGDLMAFIQYSMMIIMSFLMLSMTSIMLPRAWVAAKRVAAVLNTENSIREVETGKPFDETKKGTVEFRDVSFRYPNAEENVIEHISFTAGRGETTAFIGATGAGVNADQPHPALYDVTEGRFSSTAWTCAGTRRPARPHRTGPQKGVLFSGTIESNIAYAGNVTDGDTVRWAAKIAQADTFIGEKPDGYDSEIAQGGTNVSGGQRQRLAIARAIAKRPEIYIFDDSFSALDYATDQKLREALREVSAESTVLIVAQRISTVLNADRIIVLDGGRVAGMGTHKELMESCEEYRQIALSQLSAEEAGR
ncbi:MAG: ABC transporter ATP-binding protein [Acutalibacteraceae bacterium]